MEAQVLVENTHEDANLEEADVVNSLMEKTQIDSGFIIDATQGGNLLTSQETKQTESSGKVDESFEIISSEIVETNMVSSMKQESEVPVDNKVEVHAEAINNTKSVNVKEGACNFVNVDESDESVNIQHVTSTNSSEIGDTSTPKDTSLISSSSEEEAETNLAEESNMTSLMKQEIIEEKEEAEDHTEIGDTSTPYNTSLISSIDEQASKTNLAVETNLAPFMTQEIVEENKELEDHAHAINVAELVNGKEGVINQENLDDFTNLEEPASNEHVQASSEFEEIVDNSPPLSNESYMISMTDEAAAQTVGEFSLSNAEFLSEGNNNTPKEFLNSNELCSMEVCDKNVEALPEIGTKTIELDIDSNGSEPMKVDTDCDSEIRITGSPPAPTIVSETEDDTTESGDRENEILETAMGDSTHENSVSSTLIESNEQTMTQQDDMSQILVNIGNNGYKIQNMESDPSLLIDKLLNTPSQPGIFFDRHHDLQSPHVNMDDQDLNNSIIISIEDPDSNELNNHNLTAPAAMIHNNDDLDTVSELDTMSEYNSPYSKPTRIPRITRSNSCLAFKRRCSLQSLPHHSSRRSSISSRRSSTMSIDERPPWNYGAGGTQYQKLLYPFGKRKRLSVDNYYD